MWEVSLVNQKEVSKDRNSNIIIFLFCAICIITLIFSEVKLDYSFYINISQVIIFIGVLFIILPVIFFNMKYYLDEITFLLLLRLIIYLIPLLYMDNLESYWGNYFSVILSFCVYFIASQNHKRDVAKSINTITVIYTVLICIQVFYMFFYLHNRFDNLNINMLKYYMVIPIGGSNFIPCIVVPLMVLIFCSDMSSKIKFLVGLAGLASILVIQSKNALFVVLLFVVVRFILKYFKSLLMIKDKSKIRTAIIAITSILILSVSITFFIVIKYISDKWYMGMVISGSSIYEFFNAITSNRLYVYGKELNRWTEHLFFGNGLSYIFGYMRSHNWVIELLVQSGLAGFLTFIGALFFWYRKISKYLKVDLLIKSIFYFCIAVLVQGLAEVTLFTPIMDALFWFMIGLSVSQANYIRKRSSIESEDI